MRLGAGSDRKRRLTHARTREGDEPSVVCQLTRPDGGRWIVADYSYRADGPVACAVPEEDTDAGGGSDPALEDAPGGRRLPGVEEQRPDGRRLPVRSKRLIDVPRHGSVRLSTTLHLAGAGSGRVVDEAIRDALGSLWNTLPAPVMLWRCPVLRELRQVSGSTIRTPP